MRRKLAPGFTLIELMVVMAIIAVVLGMSTAFLTQMNRGYRFTASANQTMTIIRGARNFALANQSLSTVQIDVKNNTIVALGQKQLGSWHLDKTGSEKCGKFTLDIGGNPGHGKFGGGIALAAGSTLNGGATQDLPARQGVAISAWFFPEPTGKAGRQLLFDFGGALTVEWNEDGSITAKVGNADVTTGFGVMPSDRWTHVEVIYDRTSLAVLVNGVLHAERAETSELVLSEAAFTVSHPKLSFEGNVDEVKLGVIIRPEENELPEGVLIVGGPSRIRFDRQGNLDPAAHTGPVDVWLYSEQKEQWRKLHISMVGRVRLTEHDSGPKPGAKKSQ